MSRPRTRADENSKRSVTLLHILPMSTPKRPNAIGFLMLPYVTNRSLICAVVMNSPLPFL